MMKQALKTLAALLPAAGMALLCGCNLGEEIMPLTDDSGSRNGTALRL